MASKQHRKRITAVHKANILKLGDGLFLDCAALVAKKYPEIKHDDAIIDALSMRLVQDPSKFDVLLLENLYGDIISDLCAGLVGGLGVVPGANLGTHVAVFEAVHGSAPDIAGKGLANPTALMKSAVMMLEYIGEGAAASRLEHGIHQTLAEGETLTGDLGGEATTSQFTDAVIGNL